MTTENRTYKLTATGSDIILISSEQGAVFPCIPGNAFYEQYLIWLALGNTPLPADTE